MTWSATLKTAGLPALRLLTRLLYLLSAPLRWALYAVYSVIVFLLSPFRAIFGATVGVASTVMDMIARLKYLYIYLVCAAFIGVCAAFMLHGTLNFFVAFLGLNDTSERQQQKLWDAPEHSRPPFSFDEEDDNDKFYDDLSGPDSIGRHLDPRRDLARTHQDNSSSPYEERWKLLRTAEQPRRRRKGLLGQTIHEESSESDLS